MKEAFLSEIIFTRPEYLSGYSAWSGHIPFAFWLIEQFKPRTVVELGTHRGDSYLAFCQAVKKLNLSQKIRCYGVDTWEGDKHAGSYSSEIYQALAAYHDPKYADFSTLIRATFDEALSKFEDKSVDLLHIDGLHTYEAVKHDFETWFSKLSERAIVIFHDTMVHREDFGVHRFWGEISPRYPHFNFLHSHGLGVLAVGNQLAQPLEALFDERHQERLRLIFSTLGEGVISRQRLNRIESSKFWKVAKLGKKFLRIFSRS